MRIRVVLPAHLRALAKVQGEVTVTSAEPVTLGSVLDSLEALHPVLRGAIRDQASGRRRAFVRFYACEEDLSQEGYEYALPAAVVEGREPLLVIGAMAGG